MPSISVIIRSKNEERWIGQCLRKVMDQTLPATEIILVDNESTDATVEKARAICPDVIVRTVGEYRPGDALNTGIAAGSGEFIVCLSAHCVPERKDWLAALHANFSDEHVAGVYGRQKPVDFTDDTDKRDMWLLFGMDKRIQRKDYFFHNANSMLRRSLWEQFPFDPTLTNIEDRAWGKQIVSAGYSLVYEPEASVYHHHGVHQNGNPERCRNVVKIMETIDEEPASGTLTADEQEIAAFIPLRASDSWWQGEFKPLIRRTIDQARDCRGIDRIIVSCDDEEIAAFCRECGAETPFLRPPELASVRADEVHAHTLRTLNEQGYFPDLVLPLETTYPFRPAGVLDKVIDLLLQYGYDSIMTGYSEIRPIWTKSNGGFERIDHFGTPRDERTPLYVGLQSVGCVAHADVVRSGCRIGPNVGIYEIDDPLCGIEIRTPEQYRIFRDTLDHWDRTRNAS